MRPAWSRLPTWIVLFCLGLPVYLFTLPADLRNNADTVDRFFVTRQIVHSHNLEVQCGGPPPSDSRLVPGRHGCYYAIYAPGQSLLMIPLYAIGKGVAEATKLPQDFAVATSVRTLDPILGALVLILFYLLALEAGYRRRTAILLSLMLAFASTLWPGVQSGQEQTQITLAIVAAAYAGIRAARAPIERDRRRWLLLGGASMGFGLLTRYDFVIYAVVLAGFLVSLRLSAPSRGLGRKRTRLTVRASWAGTRASPGSGPRVSMSQILRTRPPGPAHHDLLPLLIGLAPFILLDGVWNTARFGAPWRVGQSISAQFGLPIWQGIPNLLVSPGKGLIWYLPLLWLLPLTWRSFQKRAPHLLWLGVALLVAAVLFYANVVYWHGDPAWGPRYLFPVAPLLLLPLGEIFESFASFRLSTKVFCALVISLSLALQLAAVSVDPWRFWYHLIQQRQQAGQVFHWQPRSYGYYWSTRADFDPELYQFAAVRDVVRIGLGNESAIMAEPSTKPDAPWKSRCAAATPARPREWDRCQRSGVGLRPLDTVSPLWLNDRYQWLTPEPVPLSLIARILIMGALIILAALSGLVLHLQFWASQGETRSRYLTAESADSRVRPQAGV